MTGFAKRGLVRTGTISSLTFHCHSIDTINSRLTVHACTIAKGLTVLLLRPHSRACLASIGVRGWSIKGSSLPGQADRGQGITTDWLVRLGINVATFCDMWSWKQPELKPFGHKKVFIPELPATSWLPTTLHPYRSACGIDYLVK